MFVSGVGFFPLWIVLEYIQMVAVVPLNNFRIIPFVYDIFKPFFVTHFVFTDQNLFFPNIEDSYYNINYDYLKLSISKISHSLIFIGFGLAIILSTNIIVAIAYYLCPSRFVKTK